MFLNKLYVFQQPAAAEQSAASVSQIPAGLRWYATKNETGKVDSNRRAVAASSSELTFLPAVKKVTGATNSR